MSEKQELQDAVEQETVVSEEATPGRTESLINENGKKVIYGLGGVAVLVGAYILYGMFVSAPAEVAATEAGWRSEAYVLDTEDYQTAISGDDSYLGLEAIVSQHGGTGQGDISTYELGIAYLNNGQFSEAIATLSSVDFGDELITSVAFGAIGDANMELGNTSEAISYYEQAYENSENSLTAPVYLKKAGFALELDNQFKEAKALYERIRDEYPRSAEGKLIDKLIVRVEMKM